MFLLSSDGIKNKLQSPLRQFLDALLNNVVACSSSIGSSKCSSNSSSRSAVVKKVIKKGQSLAPPSHALEGVKGVEEGARVTATQRHLYEAHTTMPWALQPLRRLQQEGAALPSKKGASTLKRGGDDNSKGGREGNLPQPAAHNRKAQGKGE